MAAPQRRTTHDVGLDRTTCAPRLVSLGIPFTSAQEISGLSRTQQRVDLISSDIIVVPALLCTLCQAVSQLSAECKATYASWRLSGCLHHALCARAACWMQQMLLAIDTPHQMW